MSFALPSPPLPREHGAWVMLLMPLVAASAGLRPFRPLEAALLAVAAVALFLAQGAVSELFKRKPKPGATFWLAAFGALGGVSALALLALGHWALAVLAVPAGLLFALHLHLLRGPIAQRLDRSLWGELLAAGVLTLGAPAACAIARGGLDAVALASWAACFLAFASGVLHVAMRLDAVKRKGPFDAAARAELCRPMLAFHAGLGLLALSAPMWLSFGWIVPVAYAPFVVRAGWAWGRLRPGVPSFKRIGIWEAGLSVWFAAWLIGYMRLVI